MKVTIKSISSLIVGLMLLLGWINASAGDVIRDEKNSKEANFEFEKTQSSNAVTVHFFNISTKSPATVTVYTLRGKKIFQESLQSKASLDRKYDFSHLKAGKYRVTLQSEDKQISKTIVVGLNGSFREDKSHLFTNFKPVVMLQKDCVKVMFENKTDEQIKVRLLGAESYPLYTEYVEGAQSYGKIIKTDKLPSGTYTLVVSSPDYYFTQDIAHKKFR